MAHEYLVNGKPYWIADQAVCEGHSSPMDVMEAMVFDRPSNMLTLGPRGSGKSHGAAFATHLDSIRFDNHGTKILGGSEAQSRQVYHALGDFRQRVGRYEPLMEFTKEQATYCTGSTVSYVAASSKSVRGPHVPTLRLDEVDEMDADIRESAYGMCMDLGANASVTMTSTWHKVGGPMGELLKKGDDGAFPVHRYCVWEVLERCPEERSGPNLERCPDCPLMKWCHADRDGHGKGVPKAKRSNGHYTINALIQKVQGISERVFESDFLCTGPRADGIWFTQFDERNTGLDAEYDPKLPVFCSVDSGVRTGAVFLQFRETQNGPYCNVFGDYFSEGQSAEICAMEILAALRDRCGDARRRVSTDSAGGARNPLAIPVISEYARCGLTGDHGIENWPKYSGSVASSLATLEAMVRSADGTVSLKIHPRCKDLIAAFKGYSRAKIAGVFRDMPKAEDHPYEDMIDPLRGQLAILLPEGRKPPIRADRWERPGRIF